MSAACGGTSVLRPLPAVFAVLTSRSAVRRKLRGADRRSDSMARRTLLTAPAALIGVRPSSRSPAAAQFGTISAAPPRPPADVPGGASPLSRRPLYPAGPTPPWSISRRSSRHRRQLSAAARISAAGYPPRATRREASAAAQPCRRRPARAAAGGQPAAPAAASPACRRDSARRAARRRDAGHARSRRATRS